MALTSPIMVSLSSLLQSQVDITSKHLCCYFTVLMSYHNHRLKEFVVCCCFSVYFVFSAFSSGLFL